uniref:G-protein coupled receptors family 1 profile domain-containing protein n=1 Tax=Haplochromis burtoni TaxID=8153 RepID=A0A3Q3BWA3_HAPBU
MTPSNSTFVRPAIFYLSGFSNIPHVKCFWLVKTLHTPKYMIVFNMALTDLCGSTALIPKVLDTFLFLLSTRTAICFPLRYHMSVIATMVGLVNRLSFCRSLVVNSFFCDHGPVYRLACNDTSLNYNMGSALVAILVIIPLIFIIATYVCIFIALSRTTSREERLRALKTCTSHLILVVIFFLPIGITNIAAMTSYIDSNARMINSVLTHTIPALLDPIVYALKTEEVMNAVKKLCKGINLNRMKAKTRPCNHCCIKSQVFQNMLWTVVKSVEK